jgi:hypothetical protein
MRESFSHILLTKFPHTVYADERDRSDTQVGKTTFKNGLKSQS